MRNVAITNSSHPQVHFLCMHLVSRRRSTTDDDPLVVQFAANTSFALSTAAQLVANHTDGVGLNCGCPQRWALKEGIGACLIENSELVSDMVGRMFQFLTAFLLSDTNNMEKVTCQLPPEERVGKDSSTSGHEENGGFVQTGEREKQVAWQREQMPFCS